MSPDTREQDSRRPDSANAQAIARLQQDLDERGTVKWDVPIRDRRGLEAWRENLPNRQ